MPGVLESASSGVDRLEKEKVASLARDVARAAELFASGDQGLEVAARMQTAAAAQALLDAVRPAPEVVLTWFQSGAVISAVRIFQDWNMFDTIPEHGSMTYSELAVKGKAEETLLVRIAAMLTSTGVLKATGLDRVAHTPISLVLRENEPMGSMFKVMFGNVIDAATILPSYFSTYGRREPFGLTHTPLAYLEGEPDVPYFELLHRNPDGMRNFMKAMSISHRRVPTVGMYDPSWVLEKTASDKNKTRPVWVDVGGGSGHTILLFLRTYPDLPASRCVVQDLPEVCDEAARHATDDDLLKHVQWVALDFHKDTPVEGAMVYYFRHVVRDYSDDVVMHMLALTASVMADDSRLLISEQLTVGPPSTFSAFKDFVMLAVGGKERTLDGFARVVTAAGLRITGVFPDKATPHAVIECGKA